MADKKLVFCDDIRENDRFVGHKFCAPVFIANSSFGTLLESDKDLVFDEITGDSVRSGTLTFISYKGVLLALTCRHVVEALQTKRKQSQLEDFEKYEDDFGHFHFHLYTPIEQNQFHFYYELTPVPPNSDGSKPDVAIARVDRNVITRLNRIPLLFTDKKILPESGMACGYPEQQRTLTAGKHLNTFAPRIVYCPATLQTTGNGDVMLQDEILDHNGVDNLSGMSGGPILWSNSKRFGLAGIVYEGTDIQGREDRLVEGSSILIRGERITAEKLDQWLPHIPANSRVKEQSTTLYVPPELRS